MSTPRVIRQEKVQPIQRAPGVAVCQIVTKDTGATQISSGVTTFDPGCSNATHFHNAEESVIVVEGEGIIVINGEEHQLKLYDGALITPGTHHRLINTGDRPFRIAWSYVTVDVTRTMVEDS